MRSGRKELVNKRGNFVVESGKRNGRSSSGKWEAEDGKWKEESKLRERRVESGNVVAQRGMSGAEEDSVTDSGKRNVERGKNHGKGSPYEGKERKGVV